MDLQGDLAQVERFTSQVQPGIDRRQEAAVRQGVPPVHLENLTWKLMMVGGLMMVEGRNVK